MTRLLDAVDDAKLRQVMRLVEASGQRRSLEAALAGMRPRLRKLRPARPLTLPRLLTVPFETVLVNASETDWPMAIGRGRLAVWHELIIGGLDPASRTAAQALVDGRAADDRAAILAAGRQVWPAAAALLADDCSADEKPAARTDRLRAADLLGIGVDLVPLCWRLTPPLGALDPDEEAALRELLALAEKGPPDRLGLVTTMVLRAADQPAAVAKALAALAPGAAAQRLRPVLDQLLRAHRSRLEQRVAEADAAASLPLDAVADELWQLADALVGLDGQRAEECRSDPEITALRRRAATLAQQRYATSLGAVVVPLPHAAGTARVAAVKAREAQARQLARLGRAAKRLAPEASVQRQTEAALEGLLGRGGTSTRAVDVDDARLVEILLGPDAAWQLLRPPR